MPKPVSIAQLFRRNRNFAKLYIARVVSLFGDWFHFLAIIALLRTMGRGDASEVAWLLIFKTLPSLVMTPLAGVAADRYSRRSIMIMTDVVRCLIVLSIYLVLWFPSVTLLYSLVILQAALSSFFDPARQAIVPDIVLPEELTAANAVGAVTWSIMLTLGSAIGGVFTAYFGWEWALAVDALSYVISGLFLIFVFEPPWQKEAALARESSFGMRLLSALGILDMITGLRYVLSRPRILSLMLCKCGWCLAGGITLILTILGEKVYPIWGQAMLGVALLYAARGLGTGIGPLLGRWWTRSDEKLMEKSIFFAYLCGTVFYLALTMAPNALTAALFVVLAHLGGSTVWVFSTIRLQQLVPSQIRGRVFAAEQGLFTAMLSLSTWVYGQLLDHNTLSLSGTVACLGLTLIVPAALWAVRGHVLGWAGPEALQEAQINQPAPSSPLEYEEHDSFDLSVDRES
jgi:MFS family permease